MKKIVFLTWDSKKNGGNILNFKFAEILRRQGYDSSVVSFRKPTADISCFDINFVSFWNFLFKFKKPEILIATFWPTAYLSLFFPADEKIYFIRNWETNFYKNPLLRFLALFSLKLPFKKIFTISKFLDEKIKQVTTTKTYLIPDPIDVNLFKPGRKKQQKSKKEILSVVSRYGFFKGMDRLVMVVKALKKRNKDFVFTLISFEKKSYSSCFDRFVSDPPQSVLVKEYQKADVFLTTSLTEGFSLTPREAMACGCPVVTTDSGGINEYAKNNYNCFLAKTAEDILKDKLVERIIKDQELKKKFTKNGLITARKYSWDRSVKIMEEIINDR